MGKIAKSFMWKSIKGPIAPRDMETSHLFFVVRMLWNNCAPAHLKLEPYKRWKIHYSAEYQKEAVQQMLMELSKRPDVEERFLQQLQFMKNHSQKVMT